MTLKFGPRRGTYIDISKELKGGKKPLSDADLRRFETLDLLYRSLCALLFNYVPTSGHPGGSISSGRLISTLLFDSLNYDVTDPNRPDADLISLQQGTRPWAFTPCGHSETKSFDWSPDLLPRNEALQLRLEDLLGFRRNPVTKTPLFIKFRAKALDGHPTPATPFVRLSTGASG